MAGISKYIKLYEQFIDFEDMSEEEIFGKKDLDLYEIMILEKNLLLSRVIEYAPSARIEGRKVCCSVEDFLNMPNPFFAGNHFNSLDEFIQKYEQLIENGAENIRVGINVSFDNEGGYNYGYYDQKTKTFISRMGSVITSTISDIIFFEGDFTERQIIGIFDPYRPDDVTEWGETWTAWWD